MKATRLLETSIASAMGLAFTLIAPVRAADTVALEEITITAEKRADNIQKTAISVTAVSGEDINQQGRNDITDVLKDVPGVTLNNSPGGNFQVNIRGIAGGGLPGFDGDPGASLNIDGSYNSPLVGGPSQVSFFDVERVEVLRGPQGTLYGRNAESGAINVISGNPGKQYAASGTLEAGNYNLIRAAGMVNAPLNDNWAVRAAFTTINRDGYFTSGGQSAVASGGRVKLQFDAGGALRVLLGSEYTKVGGTVGVGGMGNGIPAWGLGDPPADPYDDITKNGGVSGSIPGTSQNNRTLKLWSQVDWDTGIGTFTVLPAHVKALTSNFVYAFPMGGTPGVYSQRPSNGAGWQDTVEARLASASSSPLKWIAGAFYMKAKNDTSATANSVTRLIVNAQSHAIFGQATLSATDTFRVTAGVRETWDKKDYWSSNPTNSGLGVPGGGAGDWKRFDWKVGVEKDLSDSSMLFANVSTGYRPGSITTGSASMVAGPGGVPVPNSNLFTKPEKLLAFEIGSKNQFFNDRLRVNADAYYYDYKDRQYTYFTTTAVLTVPCPNGQMPLQFGADVVCLIELNANKVRMIGAEIETQWLVTANDEVSVGLAFLDAKAAESQIVQLANPLPLPAQPREFNVDIKDKTMPNSPKLQVNVAYQHAFNVFGGQLTPRADARYTSKKYLQAFQYLTDVINTAGYREGDKYVQKGYTVYDLSLGYTSGDGKWNLNAYIKNAGSAVYKTITDGTTTTVGTPKTVGAVLSVKM